MAKVLLPTQRVIKNREVVVVRATVNLVEVNDNKQSLITFDLTAFSVLMPFKNIKEKLMKKLYISHSISYQNDFSKTILDQIEIASSESS